MNESCHIYEWVMSPVNRHLHMKVISCMNVTYSYVCHVCHVWIRHVTYMNESCHMWIGICIWMSYLIWMSRIVTYNTYVTYCSWWVLQHCTGFARLVWGRLRVHRAVVYSDWFVCSVWFCSLLPVSLSSCPFLDILHCLPRAVGVPLESALNLVSRMSPCGAHDTHACCARSNDHLLYLLW